MLPSAMDVAMSEAAMELIRAKGGTVAVDYIPAIG